MKDFFKTKHQFSILKIYLCRRKLSYLIAEYLKKFSRPWLGVNHFRVCFASTMSLYNTKFRLRQENFPVACCSYLDLNRYSSIKIKNLNAVSAFNV